MLRISETSILGKAFAGSNPMISDKISDQPDHKSIDRYTDMNRMSSISESSSYSIEEGSGFRHTTSLRDGTGGAASSVPGTRNARGQYVTHTFEKVIASYVIDPNATLTYREYPEIVVTNGKITSIQTPNDRTITGTCVNECGTGNELMVVGRGL